MHPLYICIYGLDRKNHWSIYVVKIIQHINKTTTKERCCLYNVRRVSSTGLKYITVNHNQSAIKPYNRWTLESSLGVSYIYYCFFFYFERTQQKKKTTELSNKLVKKQYFKITISSIITFILETFKFEKYLKKFTIFT